MSSLINWVSSQSGRGYTALPTNSAPPTRSNSPSPHSPIYSPHAISHLSATMKRRRGILIVTAISMLVSMALVAGVHLRFGEVEAAEYPVWQKPDTLPDAKADMWGVSEQLGWEQTDDSLLDPGPLADGRMKIGFEADEQGTRLYYTQLDSFARSLPAKLHTPLLTALHDTLPPSHARLLAAPEQPHRQLPSMISYKNIFQTDKKSAHNAETQLWESMNRADGWTLDFYNDTESQAWVEETFGDSQVVWAWDYLPRGVLKADFLRYLLPLVKGGVYSDTDTRPVRPIEQWGSLNVELLNLSHTDGPDWESALSTHPAVIVAVDVDVHALPQDNWSVNWPRAWGICQWTLSSAPHHPIFLDVTRRIVNSTHFVQDWDTARHARADALRSDDRPAEADALLARPTSDALSVVEWTGPATFTDAVLAYLLARYGVSWHRLRGLDHPIRIGDVLVLPITAFSPGGQPDFKAEGRDSPQCNVVHNFAGSWKGDGA